MADSGNALASLYPQPPQANALQQDPSHMIGVMNALNQNVLFQKEMAAKNAQANALQGSIGPGGFDSGTYAQAVKSSPDAAFGMDPASLLQQNGMQIDNSTKALGLLSSQNSAVLNTIGPMAQDPNLTKDKVLNIVPRLVRQGVPPDMAYGWVSGLSDDPKTLRGQVATMGNIAMDAGNSADRVPGPVDPSTGQQTSVPRGTANMAGGYPTDNPLGSDVSSRVMQSDLATAGNYAQDIYPWQKSLDLIQKLGPGGTGPGTQGRQQVESFINTLSPTIARWAGVDPQKITNYDELGKYLTQATQQRAASFGSHTDAQLATAISGSPNTHLNDLANTDVLKAAIGMKRMEAAQTMEAAKAGPAGYTQAKANWASTADPRAFVIDMMSPPQIQNLQKTLKGPERAKFNMSLQSAVSNGYITPPGQQ